MEFFKRLGQGIIHLVKQIGSLPRLVELVFKQRQQRTEFNEREAERLDRIRNPSKYLGK